MAAVDQHMQQPHQQHGGGGTGGSSGSTRAETGFYCSTSGTYFSDKESLAEHYKSDFHRYNLKRKVAGLPPVTKDWFEARKAQLTSAAAAAPNSKVWYDPLTKKKFQTQQTYQAHVNSKKYQQLVRDSGEAAPAPIIMLRQQQQQEQQQQQQYEDGSSSAAAAAQAPAGPIKPAGPAGFTVKAPARPSAGAGAGDDNDQEEGSDWETASEVSSEEEQEEDGAAEEYEEWDPCVSLFDNKVSGSMEANLRYMYKHFGFFLPDAQFLDDPDGLIKYLGAKLALGKVPLYTAGDDPSAKQFRSLHAVQRHMVDTNQCRMLFDGNEEEYEDFYDYSAANNEAQGGDGDTNAAAAAAAAADGTPSAEGKQLALAMSGLSLGSGGSSSSAAAAGGWELAVPAQGGGAAGGSKILGSRELARYYKQRPKPQDTRRSVVVNTIIAQYRSLGLATQTSTPPAVQRAAQRQQQNMQKRTQQLLFMRNNANFNLPNNVPY